MMKKGLSALGIALFTASLSMPLTVSTSATAAEITLRPDLVDRVASLRRVFPRQGAGSVLGEEPPEGFDPNAEFSYEGRSANVLLVSGVIEPGDAERLEPMMRANAPVVVAFDSPGGSFTEGFRIGEALQADLGSQDPALEAVYVLNGNRCMSACAVAFSMAVNLAIRGINDRRFVEQGAKLGFHMPYLPEDKAGQTGTVGDLLNLAYDITGAFNRLLMGGANPPHMMDEILKHRTADSFLTLNGDGDTWIYGFSPVSSTITARPATTVALDFEAGARVCTFLFENSRILKGDADIQYTDYFQSADGVTATVSEAIEQLDIKAYEYGAGTGFTCRFQVNDDNTVGVAVFRGPQECPGVEREDWDVRLCASRPGPAHLLTVGLLADSLGCSPEGLYENMRSIKHFVAKRAVNMRAEPDLEGTVIAELPIYTSVALTDCRITTDHQGVWYRIESEAGNGWVSARFIGAGLG